MSEIKLSTPHPDDKNDSQSLMINEGVVQHLNQSSLEPNVTNPPDANSNNSSDPHTKCPVSHSKATSKSSNNALKHHPKPLNDVRVESVDEFKKLNSLTPLEFRKYCKRLFECHEIR